MKAVIKCNRSSRESDRNRLFVQFHGIWGLYLGAEKMPLESGSLDEALALMEGKFGPLLRQKIKERGVRLDGDIRKHSYIALNDKGI